MAKAKSKTPAKAATKAASKVPEGASLAPSDKKVEAAKDKLQKDAQGGNEAKASKQSKSIESKYPETNLKGLKAGQVVEFIPEAPLRGVYDAASGKVMVNGEEHTPYAFRKLGADELTPIENQVSEKEAVKDETFKKLGIPNHRRGENIHEQSPYLDTAPFREQARVANVENAQEDVKNQITGEDAEAIQKAEAQEKL